MTDMGKPSEWALEEARAFFGNQPGALVRALAATLDAARRKGIEDAAQWVENIDPEQRFFCDLARDLRALADKEPT